MSSLDSLIDAIRTDIPTYDGFSTKKEVLNSYSVEDNPSTFLDDSWGLVVGESSRAGSDESVINNYVTSERSIGVVLCRPVYDVHGIGLQVNEEVKSMFADAVTIRDNFLDAAKFGVLLSGEDISYNGDSGVNFIASNEGFKFIHTQINFTFDIIETIN